MDIAISADTLVGRVEHRIFAVYEEAVNELASALPPMIQWENEHLLCENPTAADLASHQATVKHMLRCARLLSLATRQEDFPDRKLADLLAAILTTLEEKLAFLHPTQPMSLAEADQILKTVFGENCLHES